MCLLSLCVGQVSAAASSFCSNLVGGSLCPSPQHLGWCLASGLWCSWQSTSQQQAHASLSCWLACAFFFGTLAPPAFSCWGHGQSHLTPQAVRCALSLVLDCSRAACALWCAPCCAQCMFCNYKAAVGHFPSTAAELLCQGFHSFGGQAQQGIHTPACRLLCCPVAPATAAFVCPGSHVKPPCLCAVSVCFPLWSTPGLWQQQGWLRLHSVID